MAGTLGVVIGVAVVVAWTTVVILALVAVNEPSVYEAQVLRTDLAAARKQAAIAQTTADSLVDLINTPRRQR